MKKSTFAAILVFFAAIAGALTAAYMYLRRREASWMNMSSSCSVRISAMRNLRRKKPPQRTRRMTPRMTSRFKRGRAAASETEKRRNGLRAVPAFQFVKKLCFSAQLLYERSLTRLRAQPSPHSSGILFHLCLVQRSETPPQPARIRRHMLCPIRQRNGIKYKIPPARAAIFSPAFPKYRHTFGLLPLKTPSQGLSR